MAEMTGTQPSYKVSLTNSFLLQIMIKIGIDNTKQLMIVMWIRLNSSSIK